MILPLVVAAALLAPEPAAPPAESVVIQKDVPYLAPGREEKLDLYLPAARPEGVRSPGVVIIHGGGWRGGDKGASREINIGTTLAKAGYVCVSVNYRLSGKDVWPTNIQDCKNAVRFLRKNAERYAIDPDHIGVIGGSAGGHLALMVGFTSGVVPLTPPEPYPGVSDRVQAVVDMYGIANLRTRKKTDKDGNPTGVSTPGPAWMLGGGPEEFPDRWDLASPVTHISRECPPALILQGKADTTVDRDQSIELARRLKEKGVEHELVLIDGIGHTFDLQTWRRKPLPRDLRPLVVGFFDRHLKPVSARINTAGTAAPHEH
jgi:acetyl esterase/lipase